MGPADLQFDLRVRSGEVDCSYEDCLKRVADSAAGAGKASGILLRDSDDILQHRALGFSMLAVDSDLGILRKAYLAAIGSAQAL